MEKVDVEEMVVDLMKIATNATMTGGSSQGSKDAIDALAKAVTALTVHSATAAIGPVGGEIVEIAAPEMLKILADAIAALNVKIHGEVPPALAKLQAWIDGSIEPVAAPVDAAK